MLLNKPLGTRHGCRFGGSRGDHLAAGVVRQIMGEDSQQLHNRLKLPGAHDGRVEVGLAQPGLPFRALSGRQKLADHLEIALGRLPAEHLPAHEGGHVVAVQHHRHGDIGQSGKAVDLLRTLVPSEAALGADLGFEAGGAAGRRRGGEGAKTVLMGAEAPALRGFFRRHDLERDPRRLVKGVLVKLDDGQFDDVFVGGLGHAGTLGGPGLATSQMPPAAGGAVIPAPVPSAFPR